MNLNEEHIDTSRPRPAKPNLDDFTDGQPPQDTAKEALPPFPPERLRALELIASGHSITSAMESLGYSRSAFYKWTAADPLYGTWATQARGIYTSYIEDIIHEVDADARALVHQFILDPQIAPAIRLRSALSALNRRGPGWLPRPIPPYSLLPDAPLPQPEAQAPQHPTNDTKPADSTPEPAGTEADSPLPQPASVKATATNNPIPINTIRPHRTPQSEQIPTPSQPPQPPVPTNSTLSGKSVESVESAESAPTAAQAFPIQSAPHSCATNASPDPTPPPPSAPQPASSFSLSEAWLSNTFLHKHESRQDRHRAKDFREQSVRRLPVSFADNAVHAPPAPSSAQAKEALLSGSIS
ncbi:MAG: helix-turn-helix domain-containing protein [Bryobacterales bacterium]|nr:helix-turn-helix domain-containing protein [Bryobacterales bacterium]